MGQWQAKRLGVETDEAGVAPWFEEEDKEERPAAVKAVKQKAAEQAARISAGVEAAKKAKEVQPVKIVKSSFFIME